MTDSAQLAAIVKPLILADMRWPDEHWAGRRALTYADALLAAGVTMPAPPCPEWVRFGGKVINCQGRDGHEGKCW